MTDRHFVLNGKFLRAPPTGVHRVAIELSRSLAELIAEGHPQARGLSLSGLAPHDGMVRAGELPFAVRQLGPLTGIPWEQLVLPFHRRRGTLLSLCNIGPVVSRDAVTMIHDVQVLLSPQSYGRGFRYWYRTLQPAIARRNRQLLTVSDYSRRQIVAAGLCAADKVSVVHNGCDHILREIPDPRAFDRLGLEAGRYVLALANTQAHKNIGVLLRAFAALELVDVKLVLFGGADRAAFEAAGHTVAPNTVFAGRIDDGELRYLLEQALCLAFPSTTEGFGLPPAEAMLLGCPAVVAPCGALPEVCGDAALYADPDDVGAWGDRIAGLAASPGLRAELAKRGREHCKSYSWRNAAITLATILSRI